MAVHTNLLYWHQTDTGNMAVTLAPGINIVLISVKLTTTAVAADFTISVDAIEGAAYDGVIYLKDMTTTADLLWVPDLPVPFQIGDELDFALTTAQAWGLEVVYRLEM